MKKHKYDKNLDEITEREKFLFDCSDRGYYVGLVSQFMYDRKTKCIDKKGAEKDINECRVNVERKFKKTLLLALKNPKHPIIKALLDSYKYRDDLKEKRK